MSIQWWNGAQGIDKHIPNDINDTEIGYLRVVENMGETNDKE